jgi:hypothetical protein
MFNFLLFQGKNICYIYTTLQAYRDRVFVEHESPKDSLTFAFFLSNSTSPTTATSRRPRQNNSPLTEKKYCCHSCRPYMFLRIVNLIILKSELERIVGGPPLIRPYGRFRGGPPTWRRGVGYGWPWWNFRESMATPCPCPILLASRKLGSYRAR